MELDVLVFNFRKAIEIAKSNNESGEFFRKFPVGQCGNASDMLAQYLIDNKITPVTYVNGTFHGGWDNICSHTWLVVNGLVIDITGDQFKYHDKPLTYDIPVYIGPMTEFYEMFEVTPGGSHEHFGLDSHWLNYHELKNCYKTILRYL